jgi:C1A family cysteine protease
MFNTNSAGFIKVDESSGLGGGHAVEVIGINAEKKYVTIINSWGTGWGVNGRCYMSWSDLGRLLADWGECLTYVTD